MKNRCIDYNNCKFKSCFLCQRNAIIRCCACASCKHVYFRFNSKSNKGCPNCEYGASYGAYFVYCNYFKVFYKLLFQGTIIDKIIKKLTEKIRALKQNHLIISEEDLDVFNNDCD